MNEFKSFSRNKLIRISHKRYVSVKVLNIGESIIFNSNFVEWKKCELIEIKYKVMIRGREKRKFRKQHMENVRGLKKYLVSELIDIALEKKPRYLNKKDIDYIISETMAINKQEDSEKDKKPSGKKSKVVENPIQELIGKIVINTGWTKKDIFELYPDELMLIMESINNAEDLKFIELEIMTLNASNPTKEYLNKLKGKLRAVQSGVKKGQPFRDEEAWQKLKHGGL